MAKFGINDILTAKNAASGADKVSEFKEIWLSPYEVRLSESNFYSQEKIEELADSFLAVGQQQPTVLGRVNGEFIIVSGHRRNLANICNIERGYTNYEKVRYLYKDMTPAVLELSLLTGNIYNRELTAWERTQQAQKFKEALLRAKEEGGINLKGSLRDMVAELMNESSSNIAKMDSINKNALPEIKEELKKGNLGITAAYEAAKLPAGKQKEIAARSAENGSVQVKDITGELEEIKAESDSKAGSENKMFDSNIGLPVPSEEKDRSIKEKLADTYTRLMKEWMEKNTGSMTKAAETAVQKVFESNIPQKEWTDAEWVVFTAREIMQKADCVTTEDLYLMKDILMRCQEVW